MPSLSPRSKASRIKTLENQAARLRNQLKAASAEYRSKREEGLLRRKQTLLNQLKRANSNVRRARSAAAKKRAATVALNMAIQNELKRFAKNNVGVLGVQYRGGPPMRPRRA